MEAHHSCNMRMQMQFLQNQTLRRNMTPVYVALSVLHRNIHTVTGHYSKNTPVVRMLYHFSAR